MNNLFGAFWPAWDLADLELGKVGIVGRGEGMGQGLAEERSVCQRLTHADSVFGVRKCAALVICRVRWSASEML